METTTQLRSWLGDIKTALEAGTGLKMSPAPFSSAATPKMLVDHSFTLALNSRNSGKYRTDDTLVRANHTLVVTVCVHIKPMDQFESLLTAVDIEHRVNAKIMPRGALPDTVVTWDSTRRPMSGSREYLFVEITYGCEADLLLSDEVTDA